MHQRTWLSILTFPIVFGLTAPMVPVPRPQARAQDGRTAKQDPLAGISDIQDVLGLIRENYVDPVDMEKVIEGGIQAALTRAHILNSYLSPEELRAPDPGPADLGMKVVKRGMYAQVLVVFPNGPAAKAGLIPGDVIRKVDGLSVGSMTPWSLERRLHGAPGSAVTLYRTAIATLESKTLELKREVVPVPPLEVRSEERGTVLRFLDLSAGRASEAEQALEKADPKKPILLDLRHCVGGSLQEAAKLASLMGLKGTLVKIQETGKEDLEITVPPTSGKTRGNIALLLGTGTSGPSEVLASVAKHSKLSTLGERTAALGALTQRIPLRMGGAVELVYQRWIGVGGERLDHQPVVPRQVLRGLRPDEDPVPKALELLASSEPGKVTELRRPKDWLLNAVPSALIG